MSVSRKTPRGRGCGRAAYPRLGSGLQLPPNKIMKYSPCLERLIGTLRGVGGGGVGGLNAHNKDLIRPI